MLLDRRRSLPTAAGNRHEFLRSDERLSDKKLEKRHRILCPEIFRNIISEAKRVFVFQLCPTRLSTLVGYMTHIRLDRRRRGRTWNTNMRLRDRDHFKFRYSEIPFRQPKFAIASNYLTSTTHISIKALPLHPNSIPTREQPIHPNQHLNQRPTACTLNQRRRAGEFLEPCIKS